MLGLLSWMIQPMFDRIFIGGDRRRVPYVGGAVCGIFVLRALRRVWAAGADGDRSGSGSRPGCRPTWSGT